MELDSQRIRELLGEVADRLNPDGPQHIIVLAGGSLLAWHGLRDSTRDVDSLRQVDSEVAVAAAEVAHDHGLAPQWLNAHAAMFTPATLNLDECRVLAEHPRLLVLGAPFDQIFLMKLYAARARDLDDLRVLWPLTGYVSPQDAVDQYWQAYPHAPEDPYLVNFIADIARDQPGPRAPETQRQSR